MSSSGGTTTLGVVQAMEAAVAQILQGSFDADSQTCLLTLHKVLDNVLSKPSDERVRCIRLQNAAFTKKVASRPGGVDFLLACGFSYRQAPTPLLASADTVGEETLVLLPANEQTSRLVTARRLIRQRLVQDLGLKEDQLPVLVPPAPPVGTMASSSSSSSSAAFNPYVGHRYDAQSAAVGAQLGPDANYVSATNQQLQVLQARQKRLQAQAAQQFTDRHWQALRPGETVVSTAATASPSTAPSDSALLAQRAKALAVQQQQRENGALTTAAMRQVKALQSAKVYSHVQLTIQFANQMRLTGRFLPTETIATVIEALLRDCLHLPHLGAAGSSTSSSPFDLYLAPPRRLLPLKATLQQEGLVPAAKIFASWKKGAAPPAEVVDFFQPHVWKTGNDSSPTNATPATVFPSAQPLVPNAKAKTPTTTEASASAPQPQKKKESKEDRMLKRMMGKK